MGPFQQDLQSLFNRDLNRLIENVELTPEAKLWESPQGVTNSIGVLTQHLVGNLNHFVGEGVGSTGYIRQRELEFTDTKRPKEELINDIQDLMDVLDQIFQNLKDEELSMDYPLDVPFEATTRSFLIHLYGHLNYHLGQINYLRRLVDPKA